MGQDGYKEWACVDCGHEVLSKNLPYFKWTDGHKCRFVEVKNFTVTKNEENK